MSKNETFLDHYRQLEDILEQRFPKRNSTTSPIFLYERLIHGEKGRKVALLRETRNFLIHTPKFSEADIVEVGQEIIDFLLQLIDELSKPVTVYEKSTKFEELLCASTNTNIQELMNQMIDKGYSHVPILNKNNILIGVFSESVMFSYYALNKGIEAPEEIRKIIDFTMIQNHRNETYDFIHCNALVDEARKRFEEPKKDKRLVLLFVTENGKMEEEIKGILTPWSVL